MAMSINTNANAMAALRTLNQTQRSLSQVQGRIESGYRIANARHDASSFAIAQGMRSDVSGLKAVKETLNIGISTVEVASAAAKRISDGLIEMQNAIVKGQAENLDTNIIQDDVDNRLAALQAIVDGAQFNGVNLLNGASADLTVITGLNRTSPTQMNVGTVVVSNQDASLGGLGINGLQLDANSFKSGTGSSLAVSAGNVFTIEYDTDGDGTMDATAVFEIADGTGALASSVSATQAVFDVVVTTTDSTLTRLGKLIDRVNSADMGFTMSLSNDGTISVKGGQITGVTTDIAGVTDGAAFVTSTGAIAAIDSAQANMKNIMAYLGSAANRLESQADFVQELQDNLDVGIGTLVDADLAAESARLNALQTREQLGIQSLSIANQASQSVLSLFR